MSEDQSGALPAKTALRDQLSAQRRRRPLVEVAEGARSLAEGLLAREEVRRAATVTAYVSVGSEPGTSALLDGLLAAGKRVLLPLTTRELDLDWAVYDGPDSLVPARYGLMEPGTPPLGLEAIAGADVALVPGLGVSADGVRIGKGGGCYDKALARLPEDRWRCVLLFADETGQPVPREPHDQLVHAVATPEGVTDLRPPRPARG